MKPQVCFGAHGARYAAKGGFKAFQLFFHN